MTECVPELRACSGYCCVCCFLFALTVWVCRAVGGEGEGTLGGTEGITKGRDNIVIWLLVMLYCTALYRSTDTFCCYSGTVSFDVMRSSSSV